MSLSFSLLCLRLCQPFSLSLSLSLFLKFSLFPLSVAAWYLMQNEERCSALTNRVNTPSPLPSPTPPPCLRVSLWGNKEGSYTFQSLSPRACVRACGRGRGRKGGGECAKKINLATKTKTDENQFPPFNGGAKKDFYVWCALASGGSIGITALEHLSYHPVVQDGWQREREERWRGKIFEMCKNWQIFYVLK